MGHKLNGCRNGQMCACGALSAHVGGVCEKCYYRTRWLRRKMHHSHGHG